MNARALPARSNLHLFQSKLGKHLFVPDGSRVYDLDETVAQKLESLFDSRGADEIWDLLGLEGRPTHTWLDERPSPPPPLRSISLNIAQACNMACSYCYADEGRFGGKARMMPPDIARLSVDRLITESEPGASLLVGFMGGEPLLNRNLLREIVPYATERGNATGHPVRFSITTNATLITPEDAQLFSAYPFAVQISIDGTRMTNDRQRPMRDGGGSYRHILRGLELLLRGRPRQLSARMTVAHDSPELLPALQHLIGLGFDDVGFAPVLVARAGHALDGSDFGDLLREMIACGRETLAHLKAGRSFPFTNFLSAMDQIHRGTHRPYPCGAGAAYLSASAEGGLYACHRLVDDPAFAMGKVNTGSDLAARTKHLATSHVDQMDPCRTCWARYLCGGGCYHEVARRGRPGCDFIRGWLNFCLGAYAELSSLWPHGLPIPFATSIFPDDPLLFPD
jgi:uncharacterized protein